MNKRIRKKHEKELYNQELTRGGGYFTSLKSKTRKVDKKWIAISLLIIVMIGMIIFVKVSYAYLYQTLRGQKSYSLKVKGFSLKLDDSSTSENIKIENSTPVSDSEGKQSNAYTFSIINEDTNDTGYVLYLDDVSIDNEINRMKDTNMKYQLIENGKETVGLVSDLGTNPFRILTNGVIGGNQTNTYSLRFWIKEDAEVPAGQVFNVKIRVIATNKEAIEEGKLVFGDTVVTSDSGITQMTSDELQNYVNKSLEGVLEKNRKQLLDEAHPIGSIYITESNQNPTEIFGGTWEKYGTGKTLVGLDENVEKYNKIGKTGGNAKGETTLTTEQLPAHNHAYTPNGSIKSELTNATALSEGSAHNHPIYWDIIGKNYSFSNWVNENGTGVNLGFAIKNSAFYKGDSRDGTVTTGITGEHTHSVTGSITSTFTGTKSTTESTGNGVSISTQDPYIVVRMWKRIK